MTTRINYELPVEPGQSFVVDAFKPEDAVGVASLFYSVYGAEYPVETYYIPERLIAENADGNIYSAVARTGKGDIIGHGAIYRSSPPNPNLFEVGQYLVLKSYRTTFAAFKLNKFITEYLAPRVPMCGYFAETVTHHQFTQKAGVRAGAKEVALELDLMPAESYEKDAGTTHRISCLVYYRSYQDQPQLVHVPAVYEKAMAFLASDLGLNRQYVAATGALPPNSRTHLKSSFFRQAGVGRANVMELGADLETAITDLEIQAELEQAVVIQLFINLNQPGGGAASDYLRSKGYCLGGYIPRWFDSDALLMQRLKTRPGFETLNLYSERAHTLLQLVRQDWDQTHL
jgi:hypothetical protein